MKPFAQISIGACTGALAAFVWFMAHPNEPQTQSTHPAADDVSERATGSAGPEVVEALPPEAEQEYASASEWAFIDPEGFLGHAGSAASIAPLVGGLNELIAVDPERVWTIVAPFNGKGSDEIDALYLKAIRGMVGRDPPGAIARLQNVAAGPQRDPVLAAIAEAYAAFDADGALAWTMSIQPASAEALNSVLETVASSDLLRAHDMMRLAGDRIPDTTLIGPALARAALGGGQAPATLASALAARGDDDASNILGTLMSDWTLQEPESAVAWMNNNETYLTDELTRSTVYNLAFEDVTLAAELTALVPASAQQQWLAEVANRYGQFDIEAALRWLPEHAHRAGYAEILNRTLLGAVTLSRASPEPVARFIETSTAEISEEAIMRTGYAYADQDPQAAMRWALGLSNPEHARTAASAAADAWAANDGSAAQNWAMTQPRGPMRDVILSSMLESSPFYEGIDHRALVRAHTSVDAAQDSIYWFIVRDVANRREVTAESQARVDWMLEQLTDPVLRQQALEQIAAVESQ